MSRLVSKCLALDYRVLDFLLQAASTSVASFQLHFDNDLKCNRLAGIVHVHPTGEGAHALPKAEGHIMPDHTRRAKR